MSLSVIAGIGRCFFFLSFFLSFLLSFFLHFFISSLSFLSLARLRVGWVYDKEMQEVGRDE